MKSKYLSVMAVVMTAVFVLLSLPVSAALSYERVNKDYRNMQIMNKQGVVINKPTAQFAAKRIVNGEIVNAVASYAEYDCTTDFPTLTCYVGDTLTFEDLSHDNNQDGKIIEWDWQYYGSLGDHNKIYKDNIVNSTSMVLDNPGETIFYLCVKNNAKVKTGCCDPWSENGNHQVVGKNKWFPKGAYWYFTAIRVIVKPVREAKVHIRYWDAQNNTVFHEGYVNAGMILNDADTVDTCFNITDWEGYQYSGWNVQLMDGTIQYSGTDRNACITLAGWVPEKYLNVEFYPYTHTSVEVRYWDSGNNEIISSSQLNGEKVVKDQETSITAQLYPPDGYKITGWNVQLMDGTVQYTGTDNPIQITLSGYIPNKYLNVECRPISNTKITVRYIDTDTKEEISSRIIWGEEVYGNQETAVEVDLDDILGYVITGWEVKLPDGEIESSGNRDSVLVKLTENKPYKIIEVSCLKLDSGENDPPGESNPPGQTVTIIPNGVCDGVIEWTETDSHAVLTGYDRNGNPIYKTCSHLFGYKSVISANAEISPDTFKSGYGFGVNVSFDLNTNLVSSTGSCTGWGRNRNSLMSVKAPTKATVYVPWDMANRLGTQNRAIEMESNGRYKFRLPVSSVSEVGARKIYTPVELAGTEEEPVSHQFEIYVSGGGITGAEFCLKLLEKITIVGDMYSDDFSGAD